MFHSVVILSDLLDPQTKPPKPRAQVLLPGRDALPHLHYYFMGTTLPPRDQGFLRIEKKKALTHNEL